MRIFLIIALFVFGQSLEASPRTHELFDFDWKFFRGESQNAQTPEFKDAGWRSVNLPHDWSIERVPGSAGIFDQKLDQGEGCLPGGIGWYRKTFTLPAAAKGKRIFIEFEGVFMQSELWLNGKSLSTHPYGYTPFEVDLTDLVKWGEPNVLAVRCHVEQPCSRWYTGAGIYRHVWLTMTEPVHVASRGTTITTSEIGRERATVHVNTQLLNQGSLRNDVELRTTLLDPAGKKICSAAQKAMEGVAHASLDQQFEVKSPELWSLEKPQLYTVTTEVLVHGKIADRNQTPFGIRTIEFTTENGFLLNGSRVQIKGVCNHHDQGCLGAAAYDRALERQIEILKSMGCNAIRTSHNPPAPKLLELCDRMGMLVMDEAFDEWKKNKTTLGYGRFFDEWSEPDLVNMIRRDRNHPSVVLWSIGNEIIEQGDDNGGEMATRLVQICHREDPTRPVTSACSNPGGATKTGFAQALDVFGINYNLGAYYPNHGKFKLIASETASDLSSRGEYHFVEKDGALNIQALHSFQATSYDLFHPDWAVYTEYQLKAIADAYWVAGEFVWTGFDYIGEPTPFPWPAVSSYSGILDLCGFPKDRFYLYQSRWSDRPMVHILPHWNWAQYEGKSIPVWCYSNAESVELFLNGKSLGEKRMDEGTLQTFVIDQHKENDGTFTPVTQESGWYHAAWAVPWQPGSLKAVAKRNGKIIAVDEVVTAGKPTRLALTVDRKKIEANGQDLAYVTVKVVDEKGHLCPEANPLVKFELTGPGKIAGVGNGDATSHEDFQASQRSAFHGLCQAVLQGCRNTPGRLHLKARAEGLQEAEISIQVTDVTPKLEGKEGR